MRRPRRPYGALGALAALTLCVLAVLGWRLSGGQLYTMTTPSMSPVTPVGSLVIDTAPTHIAVGDTVTFRPSPGGPLYTHRLVDELPGGRYKTEGWAETRPDPWTITRRQIVGKTVAQVWGVGWLYRALPFWCIGLVLYLLLRRCFANRAHYGLAALWWSTMVVVPLVAYHPLVNATEIATHLSKHGNRVLLRAVNTGLLPVRARPQTGAISHRLAPGQVRWISGPTPHGVLLVHVAVDLPWWGWAFVALAVASPLIGYLLSRRRAALPAHEESPEHAEGPGAGGDDLPAGQTVRPLPATASSGQAAPDLTTDEECGAFDAGHYCGLPAHGGTAHECLDCGEDFEAVS